MYSILGRGSFCFNYCLNSAWHGGDQFVALKKLVSRRKHEVLQNFLVNSYSDVGFQKTQWTNTSR